MGGLVKTIVRLRRVTPSIAFDFAPFLRYIDAYNCAGTVRKI
jgi:hypothetical protein